jgi:hypothetical protein
MVALIRRQRLRRWLAAMVLASWTGVAAEQRLEARPMVPDEVATNGVIDVGSRLELFTDCLLIERLDGLALRLHPPQAAPLANSPIRGAYMTVIRDGDVFRAYYRGSAPGYSGPHHDGNPGEITCYAESRDGHEWEFPDLGLHEVPGLHPNNAILAGQSPFSHNFAPFLDARPDVAAEHRFKALAGIHQRGALPGSGLHAFASADGSRWQPLQDHAVVSHADFAFDSQNVSFWSVAEGCYVCYFRTWKTPHGQLRTISRTTSTDFLHWTPAVALEPNLPGEHLYTSQTHPYVRAPHLYIALPTRFAPDRGDSTEIVFMTARAGKPYDRTFPEAFIRPGLARERWGNRANYAACNVLETGPEEMSIYHAHSGLRYTLRTDGFASLQAPYGGGEMLTKPLRFSGNRLLLNLSTAATGSARVEIQDVGGTPLPGHALADCPALVGDRIEFPVAWQQGDDLGPWAGTPLRLRVVLRDADLYAFRFAMH